MSSFGAFDDHFLFHCSPSTFSSIAMKSRPIFLRTLRLRKVPHRSVLSPPHFPLIPLRSLSTTCRLLADKPPEAERPPEPGNAPPQSPWKVFTSVLKEEIEKNQAWQQNVKELRGDVDKMADTAALKRAREMYEKSRVRLPAQDKLILDYQPD